LYGGAAGGGKTDLLIGLSRLRHKQVLIMRRTYPQLEDSVIPRSKEIFQAPKNYNNTRHTWNWDDEDFRLRLSQLEDADAVFNHQSAQYDFIGFDELTQFLQFQYEYLISRVRTTVPGRRCRVVAATNPGGEGHLWVKRRWAAWLDDMHPNPAKSGELRWYKKDTDGVEIEVAPNTPGALSRTFIKALLADNKYLGEDYRARLDSLPEPYRSHLMNGDWNAGDIMNPWQVIPTEWIRAAMDRWTDKIPTVQRKNKETGLMEDVPHPQTGVGVDVARGGKDQTCIASVYGTYCKELTCLPGYMTPDGPAVVPLVKEVLENPDVVVNVDLGGVGSDAYTSLSASGVQAEGIEFGGASRQTTDDGTMKFRNLRAEMYWRMREALDPKNNMNVALPPDLELAGDLAAPTWSASVGGILIQKKEELKDILGRSPDRGDAVVLGFHQPTVPSITMVSK